MKQPEYYEVVDALVGMAYQYLNETGELYDDLLSAGETCIDCLRHLGLLEDNRIIPEAFDINYLKNKFK